MVEPSSKRQRLLGDDPGQPLLSAFPHNNLCVPLAAIGAEEIRILVLHPGLSGSPLEASIHLVKLRSNEHTSLQQHLGAGLDNSRGDEGADGDDRDHKVEDRAVRYLRVGNMLYPVPLDYIGDGSEMAKNENANGISELLANSAGPEETLDYEAVSYVWGEPIFSHKIELVGHGTLSITKSLHAALERFRYTDNGRRLWVDAICINQADTTERSAQVAVMAKIYKQAHGVLAWLGPSQESDTLAFAAVPVVLDEHADDPGTIWKRLEAGLRKHDYCDCCSWRFGLVENVAGKALLAIGRVLLRPWFSRLWVIQEVCTSAQLRDHVTVFCGTHRISYVDLRDATQIVKSGLSPQGMLRTFSHCSCELIQQINAVWSEPNPVDNWFADIEEWPPSYLLRSLGGMSVRSCSDPHDRVYAIRSLLNLEHIPSLVPDYKLATAEVYQSLVIALLEIFGRHAQKVNNQAWALIALAGTEGGESAQIDRPSWVPNFNALTPRSRSKIDQYTKIQWLEVPQFLAAPQLFEACFEQPNKLRIRARCFAVIQEIIPNTEYPVLSEPDSDRISRAELTKFRDWYARCQHCMNMPACDEEVISHSTTFLACACQLAYLPREMEYTDGAEDHSGGWLFPEKWPEDPNVVREHFMLLCATESSQPDKARQIARIDVGGKNDHCWAPPQARPGDQICVISGTTFPFVVRKLSNGAFQMLGDGYLANTTLKQALGGGGKSRFDEDIYEEIDHPPTDDWNANDDVTQKSITEMDWITLH